MNRPTICLLFLGCFWIPACRRPQIETYRIPKEAPASMPMAMGGMQGLPDQPPAASSKDVEWKAPAGWIEQAPSSIRLGSFLIKGEKGAQADMSVVPLFGDAGGDLANINRWRGQISLEPIADGQLSHESQTITPAGRSMLYVNFSNQGKRLMAAIYHRSGRTWFFKMTGDDSVVSGAHTVFIKFLESLKFHEEKNH